MRFCVDRLSRAFLIRCVFDESAQRASVYGRPKWIDMNAACQARTHKCGQSLRINFSYQCLFLSS